MLQAGIEGLHQSGESSSNPITNLYDHNTPVISNHNNHNMMDRLGVSVDPHHGMMSLSPRSSLSSLSPPASPNGAGADLETYVPPHPPYAGGPPTYQDFVNVQRQQRDTISSYLTTDGLVSDAFDEENIAASLAQMSLNPQEAILAMNSASTPTSPHLGMYNVVPPSGENDAMHGAGIPAARGGMRLNVDPALAGTEYAAEYGNTPLSPINEGIAGVDIANLTAGPLGPAGASRSVSAAASDESVAADSGVYEASGKR